MPRTLALIDDFSVGEVSPLTEAKISSDEFKNGLREATNIIPDSHGPMIGRPGFEHITPLAIAAGQGATMFPMNYSPEDNFLIVLFDKKIQVYDKDGTRLLDGATVFSDEDLHGKNSDEHLAHAFISPQGLELIILTGKYKPYRVKLTKPANDGDPWTVAFEEVTFKAQPSAWKDGNYPTTGAFFQGRTWWGGCEDNPDTIFGSKSNDYYDLSYPTPPLDSSGIEFEISKHGRIRWLQGGRSMLVGTEAGEFILASDTGVVTPSDIRIELQSSYGSKRLQSELIGNEAVYVTSDGRKLRSMWWEWVESGWVSLDATFTAEHMTRPQIADIAFCRNPFSNIYMRLKNGNLISCSYRREKNDDPIVGWYRVRNNSMTFKAIAALDNLGTSDLWAVVASTAAGDDQHFLVRYQPHDYQDDGRYFMDNFSVIENANTNKPDFSGKLFKGDIVVVADGFHIAGATQNADGTIDLPIVAKTVAAGHPYTQRMVTMPLIRASSDSSKGSSSTHHMKRWNKVYMRLIKSYMPLVNGERPPERNVTTNDDTAEAYVDSFVQITPGFGWDRDGILTIEQDLPFRLVLTGIYGEVAVENI